MFQTSEASGGSPCITVIPGRARPSPAGSVAPLAARRRLLVVSRGDFAATSGVGPVGLVGPVGRVPGCRMPRRSLCLSDSSHDSAVHDPATSILRPMVLSNGFAGCRVRRRPVLARTRALQGGVTSGAESPWSARPAVPTLGSAHATSPVQSPSQHSNTPTLHDMPGHGHVTDERGPRQEPKPWPAPPTFSGWSPSENLPTDPG
jgi:hypothetical protein